MANLWVVITGLAVLVEMEGNPGKPCMVLLRQVPEGTIVPPKTGKEIPVHSPRVGLLPGSDEIPIGNRDVRFLPDGVKAPAITNVDPFLRVGRELTDALKVQPKFVAPRDASIDGWSRVVLPGVGKIWPVHVKKEFEVKSIETQVVLKLKEARDLEANIAKEKNKGGVANGLLYYRNIGNATPVVRFPDKEYTLSVMDDSNTKNLPVQNGEPHYVAWVANSGKASNEDFDRDFFLLYELLGEQVTKYVPVIKGAENFIIPPGQCMISYAFG
jgi:hypothetical protein